MNGVVVATHGRRCAGGCGTLVPAFADAWCPRCTARHAELERQEREKGQDAEVARLVTLWDADLDLLTRFVAGEA